MFCPRCNVSMKRLEYSYGNVDGIALGLALVLAGIAAFFFVPCMGWLLGPVMVIYGLTRGGVRVRHYYCRECGYTLNPQAGIMQEGRRR